MSEPEFRGSPALMHALGYHSPGWWIVNIGTYSLSGIAASAVIARVLFGRVFRRDPEAIVRVSIENLMAQLVVMVSLFDLVYDVMWLSWGLLLPPDPDSYPQLMAYRRFLFVFTQLLMYTSHLTLSSHLYAWVVRRSSPAKLSQRFVCRISIVVLFVLLVAAVFGYGVPTQQMKMDGTCSAHSIGACYGFAMMGLAPLAVGSVMYFYISAYRTVQSLVRRHQRTAQPHPGLGEVSVRIRNRLFKYTLLFCVNWGLDAILMWMYIFAGNKVTPNWRILLQTLWNVNAGLAGFLDASAMGWREALPKRLASQPVHGASTTSEARKHEETQHPPQQLQSQQTGSQGSSLGLDGGPEHDYQYDQELAPVKARPRVARRIFATTYNMGGSGGVLDPKQVAAWIPLDYDMYAIGLQECESVHEVVTAVQRRLGDSGVGYRHFSSEIGDATILHGKIALLVFARAADLDSGALRRIGTQQGRVHNGLNLGITRAANKGMVGLSWRWHDQTLAVVNCHFAADKKGRSGTLKRVKDAIKTLRELVLVSEDTEFDCHLQCHHVIIVGDMNFRVQERPEWVLQAVRKSVGWEAAEHSRRQERRRQGSVEEGGAGAGGGAATGWRDVRHACFRIPATARLARLAEEEEEREQHEKGKGTGAATAALNGAPAANDGNGHGGNGEAAAGLAAAPAAEEEAGPVVDERAVAAEWDEPTDGEEVGGGAANGVRDSEAERAQRMGRMLKSARVWDWLTETEELSIQMREGRVFCGFQEQVLRFPPSFKWNVGADAKGFVDPSILESLYRVAKKEGSKKDLRPPSYTDRVLVHSLPDEQRRLRLKAYDLLEGVTSSDHRPVALALDLMVQRGVIGFEHVRPQPDAVQPPARAENGDGGGGGEEASPSVPFNDVEAAICLCEVAMSGLRAQFVRPKEGKRKIGEARFLFPSLSEDPLKGQRKVLHLHDFIGFDPTRHYGSVPDASRLLGGDRSAATPAPALASHVTRFFSGSGGNGNGNGSSGGGGGKRGLASLFSGFSRGPSSGGQRSGERAEEEPVASSTLGPLGPGGVDPRLTDPALLKSLHCFRWSAASGPRNGGGGGGGDMEGSSGRGSHSHSHSHDRAPVRFATLASLEHSTHALVKLVDKSGADLGQGVICLRGLIRRVAARNKHHHSRPAPVPAPSSSPQGAAAAVAVDDDSLERGQQPPPPTPQQPAQQPRPSKGAEEGEIAESVAVELSRGGEYMGVMRCTVSLRLVGLRPQQLRLIAGESSVSGGSEQEQEEEEEGEEGTLERDDSNSLFSPAASSRRGGGVEVSFAPE